MKEYQVEEKNTKNIESTEKRLANLIPFERGVSGNPKGRPIGSKNKETIFKEVLYAKGVKETDPTRFLFGKLADILLDESQNPSVTRATVNDILDRIYGKSKSTVEHIKSKDELAGMSLELIGEFAEDVEIIEK
jgi:hypothetical protein